MNKPDIKKAETLYQKGLEAVRAERIREAIPILEEAAKLNPASAPIHQVLGYAYSQIVNEYQGDEQTANAWINKAADTFWQAITLHRQHGGLEEMQVNSAMEMVAAVDRININKSNIPPEEQRKAIFHEYKSAKELGFDLSTAVVHAAKKSNITERQMRAIIQEAGNKNW